MRLHLAIAVGLVGGLLFGLLAAVSGIPALLAITTWVAPLGTAFVNLLKMVVIPLVVSVIFVGVGTMGDLRRLGKMGLATVLFFVATSAVSILLGMGAMQILLPLANTAAVHGLAEGAPVAPLLPRPLEFLLGLIPANPFAAAASGQLLPLIVFTVLVAAATGALPETERATLMSLADGVASALITLVHWILLTAPVGVFALAAPITARTGWAMLQSLGVFILAVLLGLLVFIGTVYLPAVRLAGGMRVGTFLRGSMNPLLIALSSASSAASLPAMLEAADDLKLPRTVSSFVVPLGSALCRAGSALFQGAAIVFLARLYGVPLGITNLGGAFLATVLVSFTVAGIPAGGVMSIAPALTAVGVPLDALAVLLGVDRIPDMARTATNVGGVMTAVVVVSRAAGPDTMFDIRHPTPDDADSDLEPRTSDI